MKRAKQKQEAVKRMKMLKLSDNIIKEFQKDGIINLSENGGYLYWLNGEQQEMVDEFEREHNAVVYHIIHNYTQFGELYTLLYVSENEEEWGYDRDDLKEGYALAYVKNATDDWCSEFGGVGIKPQFGGLVRIY